MREYYFRKESMPPEEKYELCDWIFELLRIGCKYMETFPIVKYPIEANVVHTFKEKAIDRPLSEKHAMLIDEIMALLSDDLCDPRATLKELRKNFKFVKNYL